MEHQTGEHPLAARIGSIDRRRTSLIPDAQKDDEPDVSAVVRQEVAARQDAIVEAKAAPEAVPPQETPAEVSVVEEFDDISEAELERILKGREITTMDGFFEAVLPRLQRHTPETFLQLLSPRRLHILKMVASRLQERIDEALETCEFDPPDVAKLHDYSSNLGNYVLYVAGLYEHGNNPDLHVSDLVELLIEMRDDAEKIIGFIHDGPSDTHSDHLAEELRLAFEHKDIHPETAAAWLAENISVLWFEEDPFKDREDLEIILPRVLRFALKLKELSLEDANDFVSGTHAEFMNPHHPEYPICHIRGGVIVAIEMEEDELGNKTPLCILGERFHVKLKKSSGILGRQRTGNAKERITFRVNDVFEILEFDEGFERCIRMVCVRNGKDAWISPKDIKEIYAFDGVEYQQRQRVEAARREKGQGKRAAGAITNKDEDPGLRVAEHPFKISV